MEEEVIKKAISCLMEGKVLLYPTDTIWGIGCDATNSEAISTIFTIKERMPNKSFVVLVSDIHMLRRYTQVSIAVEEFLIKEEKPTSVVYENVIGLADNAYASDKTVAIRIVKTTFCQRLIRAFGRPLISTSANISGEPSALNFSEISPLIKERVNYIVSDIYAEKKFGEASQIVKFTSDFTPIYLRK